MRVAAPRGAKGFDYYSLKDHAMAETAEYGLMLWDGKSKGTVKNVANLARDHKPVVVYVAPTKAFRTIKTLDDLNGLLGEVILLHLTMAPNPPVVHRLSRRVSWVRGAHTGPSSGGVSLIGSTHTR